MQKSSCCISSCNPLQESERYNIVEVNDYADWRFNRFGPNNAEGPKGKGPDTSTHQTAHILWTRFEHVTIRQCAEGLSFLDLRREQFLQVPSSALLNLVQKPYKSRALKKSNSSKKELGFFSALKIKRFVVFIKHLCDWCIRRKNTSRHTYNCMYSQADIRNPLRYLLITE